MTHWRSLPVGRFLRPLRRAAFLMRAAKGVACAHRPYAPLAWEIRLLQTLLDAVYRSTHDVSRPFQMSANTNTRPDNIIVGQADIIANALLQ